MRQAFAIVQDKFPVFEAQITELGLANVAILMWNYHSVNGMRKNY